MTDPRRRPDDRLRGAVVGLGVSGSWTLEALAIIGGVSIVAAVDPRGQAAPGARLVGGEILSSIEALAGYGRLDLVVICTTTPTHARAAGAALKLKPRRIWIEKPRAVNRAQLEELWREEPGTDVRTLMHRLYAQETRAVMEHLDGWCQQHGPLVGIESSFIDPYAGDAGKLAALGDCWLDSGINAMSAAATLVRVGAFERALGQLPLSASVALSFEHAGAVGSLKVRTGWTEGHAQKQTVLRFADGAKLSLDHRAASLMFTSPEGGHLHEQYAPDLGAPRYARMFASYLAGDDQAPTPELDRHLHELLIDAHESLNGPA